MSTPHRLQHIHGWAVINSTPLGRKIQDVARKTQPGLIKREGYGWSDGGCWTFAAALVHWSNSELGYARIVSPRGHADHIVAHYRETIFIDADGLATGSELLEKWRRLEGIERQTYSLEPFVDPAGVDMNDIPFVRAEMFVLAERLCRTLGEFDLRALNTLCAEISTHTPISAPRLLG